MANGFDSSGSSQNGVVIGSSNTDYQQLNGNDKHLAYYNGYLWTWTRNRGSYRYEFWYSSDQGATWTENTSARIDWRYIPANPPSSITYGAGEGVPGRFVIDQNTGVAAFCAQDYGTGRFLTLYHAGSWGTTSSWVGTKQTMGSEDVGYGAPNPAGLIYNSYDISIIYAPPGYSTSYFIVYTWVQSLATPNYGGFQLCFAWHRYSTSTHAYIDSSNPLAVWYEFSGSYLGDQAGSAIEWHHAGDGYTINGEPTVWIAFGFREGSSSTDVMGVAEFICSDASASNSDIWEYNGAWYNGNDNNDYPQLLFNGYDRLYRARGDNTGYAGLWFFLVRYEHEYETGVYSIFDWTAYPTGSEGLLTTIPDYYTGMANLPGVGVDWDNNKLAYYPARPAPPGNEDYADPYAPAQICGYVDVVANNWTTDDCYLFRFDESLFDTIAYANTVSASQPAGGSGWSNTEPRSWRTSGDAWTVYDCRLSNEVTYDYSLGALKFPLNAGHGAAAFSANDGSFLGIRMYVRYNLQGPALDHLSCDDKGDIMTGATGSAGSTLTSASFTVSDDTLLVCVMHVTCNGATTEAQKLPTSLTTSGTTWTKLASSTNTSDSYDAATGVYVADSPGAGSITVESVTGGGVVNVIMHVFEYTGAASASYQVANALTFASQNDTTPVATMSSSSMKSWLMFAATGNYTTSAVASYDAQGGWRTRRNTTGTLSTYYTQIHAYISTKPSDGRATQYAQELPWVDNSIASLTALYWEILPLEYTVYDDDFTYSNGDLDTVGSTNWDTFSTVDSAYVSSNAVTTPSSTTAINSVKTPHPTDLVPYETDHWAQADVTNGSFGTWAAGVGVRMDETTGYGYFALWSSDGYYSIKRISSDGTTTLVSSTGNGTSGTRTIRLEAFGTSLTMYVDGVNKLTTNADRDFGDAAFLWEGSPGLYVQSTSTSPSIDNYSGGILGDGPSPVPAVLSSDFGGMVGAFQMYQWWNIVAAATGTTMAIDWDTNSYSSFNLERNEGWTSLLSDNFNRASLGSNWATGATGSGLNALAIGDGSANDPADKLGGTDNYAPGNGAWVDPQVLPHHPSDHTAQISGIVTENTGGAVPNDQYGPVVRFNNLLTDGSSEGYVLLFKNRTYSTPPSLGIYKLVVTGSSTVTLHQLSEILTEVDYTKTDVLGDYTAEHTLRLEVEGEHPFIRLVGYYDDEAVLWADGSKKYDGSAIDPVHSGSPGVYCYYANSKPGPIMDNFVSTHRPVTVVYDINTNSYSDGGLEEFTLYEYRVRGVKG